MRFIYFIYGFISLAVSGTFFCWFYPDFSDILSGPTFQIRLLGILLALCYGIIYTYFGIRKDKINKLSNASIIILPLSMILGLTISIFSPSCWALPEGGTTCTASAQMLYIGFRNIDTGLLYLGPVIAFIILVSSLFFHPTQKIQNLK